MDRRLSNTSVSTENDENKMLLNNILTDEYCCLSNWNWIIYYRNWMNNIFEIER